MASSHTFTKKLRSSIKSKIHTFGIEADDELPDYVMVLAANRKDKHQIKTDLQLFLGKHTNAFVDWLFEEFDQIQKVDSTDDKTLSNKASSVLSKYTLNKKSELKAYSAPESASTKNYQSSSKQFDSDSRPKRSPSVDSSSSPSERLKSRIIVPEKSKNDKHKESKSERTSQKSSLRHEERNKSRSSRSENSHTERSRRYSDVDKDRYKKNSTSSSVDFDNKEKDKLRHSTKHISSPKIRYDEVQKPRLSDESPKQLSENSEDEQDEILTVDDQQNQVKRFVIRVGDKKICRTVYVEPQNCKAKTVASERKADDEVLSNEKKRKRHVEDATETVAKILNAQSTKVSPTIAARLERFGKENAKRPRLQDPKSEKRDDFIEPYSPTMIAENYESDDERKIDEVLSDLQSAEQQQQSAVNVPSQPAAFGAVPYQQEHQYFGHLSTMPERCKFWPDCDRGDKLCAYHHPNKLCTKFPNCDYGRFCLNVHPMCKFNLKCAKMNCPYTHNTKVKQPYYQESGDESAQLFKPPASSPLPPVASTGEQNTEGKVTETSTTSPSPGRCKFWNKCTNINCKYTHPKECRYALGCFNRSCAFLHRKPDLSKYQWTPS